MAVSRAAALCQRDPAARSGRGHCTWDCCVWFEFVAWCHGGSAMRNSNWFSLRVARREPSISVFQKSARRIVRSQFGRARRKEKHFGPPYGRPKSPFFGGQRKVTQRKPTPRRPWMAGVQEMQEQFPAARALRTFPVLRVRAPATGLADSTSVCWQLTGPHRVGPPADISFAVAPRARGPDGHGWPECRKCRSNFLPVGGHPGHGPGPCASIMLCRGTRRLLFSFCQRATPRGSCRATQSDTGARRPCSRPWMAELAPARGRQGAKGTSLAVRAMHETRVDFSLPTFSCPRKRK